MTTANIAHKQEITAGSGVISPQSLTQHIQQQLAVAKPVPHSEIQAQVISHLKPINFEAEAFPELEKLKNQFDDLESQLMNPDGSINTDKGLDPIRDQWRKLGKKIDKLKVTKQHLIILTIELLVKIVKDKSLGICKHLSFVYLYNGAYWKVTDKEAFQQFLSAVAEKMGISRYVARYYKFTDELMSQFNKTTYLPAPEPIKGTERINLQNGTFEITSKGNGLRPFNYKDFFTYQLPFSYDPKATAPLFNKYLHQVLPDEDSRNVLAEYMGYVFIQPDTLKLEKVLLLFGSGANGKSVFFEIVNALLGPENVSSYSIESLTDQNGYYRAMIANKLVNYASEISGKLEASTFKQLASGEPVSARLPYGEPFTVSKYAKLIFNVNELPKDVEHTHAFFRRFLIIPFNQTIPEDQQDKELSQKIIQAELSGVFNWVLEGLNRLLIQKQFTKCKAADEARLEYQKRSDSVRSFLDEHDYSPSPIEEKSLQSIYEHYKEYCLNSGYMKVSLITFSARLTQMGYYSVKRSQGRVLFITKKDFV
ncbi:phage/plasmid primase, P4 family [Siphonobacter sp. SORGH_AS_0500]|uniref:DNA primase family protein n=1 Tax=Siphonobacter sp. SORGH_AS_0500 TaxID=1864824 RepID=UPI0028570846|nr:phage/plasmid primase, P4 family [Siphonobacter sp. SORGH_AS_0500]MDR6194935.1 putative DNA primase/helicase [Siphonobacter sp. SORGH_AS_0500]